MKYLSGIFQFSLVITLLSAATYCSGETIVFKNVNVVPMNNENIIENQIVVIKNGRIAEIGNSNSVILPADGKIIEGRGAYLMPGLADMHTHLYSAEKNPSHLIIYLAHGITTVRSMSGVPENLKWRELVKSGELLGPNIYTSGRVLTGLFSNGNNTDKFIKIFHIGIFLLPLLTGIIVYSCILLIRKINRHSRRKDTPLPKKELSALIIIPIVLLSAGYFLSQSKIIPFMTFGQYIIQSDYFISEIPNQAVHEVRNQKESGYNLLKVYDFLTESEYLEAIKEAKKIELYVSGHIPNQISIQTFAESGQQEIAHIDELQSFHWISYNSKNPSGKKYFSFDYASIPRTVALMKNNNINAVSTLVVKELMYRLIEDTPGVLAGPEYRLVRNNRKNFWRNKAKNVTTLKDQGSYRKNEMQPFLIELTKALHKSGILITTGSDVSVEGIIPGYHFHRELEILSEAGFTPYEVLEMATVNAGKIVSLMGSEDSFGTVEIGKSADLLLVSGNPLEDLANIRNRIGVMIRGNWYTQQELDKKLSDFISTY